MATIEHETVYQMTLTSREYDMLLDSLVYTIKSISSVQKAKPEYIALREQMLEVQV